jgi:hypothetical protein
MDPERPPGDSSEVRQDLAEEFIDGATREGLLGRYGSEWVTALPALITRLASENGWTIIKRLQGGRRACVLIVETRGSPVVIKLAPDVERTSREVAALKVFSQHGIGPRVLEHWTDDSGPVESSIAALELIGDGTPIRDRPAARVDPRMIATFLTEVASCGHDALPVELPSLVSHLMWRLEKPLGGGLHGAVPATRSDLEQAQLILSDLIPSSREGTWVHGSLHPGNLILMHEKLWAIDPRPCLGDSEYDIAELAVKWGSEREGRSHNLADGLTLLKRLRHHMSFDEQRAVSWMQVIVTTGV